MQPDGPKSGDRMSVRIEGAQYQALQQVVSSHPSFETVDEYVGFLVQIALKAEEPLAAGSEADKISEHLAALGYM